jgi:hypothetical protein
MRMDRNGQAPGPGSQAAWRRLAEFASLAGRVLAELASYAALGYFGASLGLAGWLRVAFAIVLPFTAIVIWALLLAPTARRRLADPGALLLELAIFIAAAAALGAAGEPALAVVLGVVACANAVTLRLLGLMQSSNPRLSQGA